MRVPGNGNDPVEVDHFYVISIYGTDFVFTCCEDNLYGLTYECEDSQLWKCIEDADKRIHFVNKLTEKYLGRHCYNKLTCFDSPGEDARCPKFTPFSDGRGYSLTADIDANGYFTQISTPFPHNHLVRAVGLHRYEHVNSPFKRFQWVIHGRLARSSAPNYYNNAADPNHDHDKTQNMDATAVQFLVDNGITNIISLNKYQLSRDERQRLATFGVSYTHLPVEDITKVLTLHQLSQANQAYIKHESGGTLVYCGSGRGRAGTVITALQLYSVVNQSTIDYISNLVEFRQSEVLDELKERLGMVCLQE